MLKNRYFPRSAEQLRESIERSLEGEGTPFQIGELIDKHGRAHWLEPLIEGLGPFVQLQLSDMANMLEVFNKSVEIFFYLCDSLTNCATVFTPGNRLEQLLILWPFSLPVSS